MVAGMLVDDSGGRTISFEPEDVPIWKSILGVGRRDVRVYGCLHCQHLQLAVYFKDEDLQRYQQFEGEQPGVLERINSDTKEIEE
jgi:hypothetical protein